jgi:putative hydrolase
MVGAMSEHILGQFDAGLPPADSDRMYLVVPNVERFASDHRLDPQQARMWAAMHEVAYHAVLEVDWVRPRFAELVDRFYQSVEFDPSGITDAIGSLEDPRGLQELLGQPTDMAELLGTSHDPDLLGALQGFVAFLEGYTDIVVRTAADGLLPDLARIDEAQSRRRTEPSDAEQGLTQMTGLRLERYHAHDAADFCEEIERRWGTEALPRVWDEPDHMPSLAELTDPVGWAARVLLD